MIQLVQSFGLMKSVNIWQERLGGKQVGGTILIIV